MGREFELKYRADAAALEAIRARFGEFQTISMETVYYDTPDGSLGRLHWTLRRRYENGVSVCTVKTPASNGGRGEWEICFPEITAAVAPLVELGAPEALLSLAAQGLEPVCGARFTRLAAQISVENTLVELALDRGTLTGGGRELPFAEVEVELKSGREADAVGFARSLAETFSLVPEPKSKVQRALELRHTGDRKHGQSE